MVCVLRETTVKGLSTVDRPQNTLIVLQFGLEDV